MAIADDILLEYGPYIPPDPARAHRHYLKQCTHHFMFTLFRTKTTDLTEFGIGHMLYLSFLRYTAFAFGTLCLILGLPLLCAYTINGEFFDYGTLRKATLGNYGPLYAEGAILAPSPGVVRPASLIEHSSQHAYL